MIKSLTIDNFALIDNLNVNFESGLSIITGETGAGKSIILGALGLILGQRADTKSLRSEKQKCIIEGHFDIASYKLEEFFDTYDLDYDENTIIRREIYPSGKSRAFVNDVPVRLDTLQLLGANLVDIHSQHQTLKLSDSDFQMNVLDAIADNSKILKKYKIELKAYKKAKKEYENLQSQQAELIKTHDYNVFLLNELVEANLKEGEKEEIEAELESLTHAEDIKSGLNDAIEIMNGEQIGVLSSLNSLRSSFVSLNGVSKNIDSFLERIESLIIESNDLSSEIENLAEETEYNPLLIDQINGRLQLIYNLEKKHNTSNVFELLNIQESLQIDVDSVENLDQEIEKLANSRDKAFEKAHSSAEKLSEKRESKIGSLVKQIGKVMNDLGMPNANLGIELTETDDLLSGGKDVVSFMLSANKGGRMEEIGKVASGGELSRVMLAVKTILSDKKKLPTIIFDEIDTGVSGDIADKIGDIMTKLSARMQVVAITHLPQIAGRGSLHFKVYKHENNGKTQTEMKVLSKNDRIDELAKMLSGKNVSESALIHAKELLKL
ncbi:MAG: DNA repair protein RecN [Flavobacteriales bacterium]|nr:DNA repair protein RecN [Flavobacteriales bacterium]